MRELEGTAAALALLSQFAMQELLMLENQTP